MVFSQANSSTPVSLRPGRGRMNRINWINCFLTSSLKSLGIQNILDYNESEAFLPWGIGYLKHVGLQPMIPSTTLGIMRTGIWFGFCLFFGFVLFYFIFLHYPSPIASAAVRGSAWWHWRLQQRMTLSQTLLGRDLQQEQDQGPSCQMTIEDQSSREREWEAPLASSKDLFVSPQ